MEKRICDICKEREASRSFKIKQSLRGHWKSRGNSGWWDSKSWTPYEDIEICGVCASKLLGIPYRDENGMPCPEHR